MNADGTIRNYTAAENAARDADEAAAAQEQIKAAAFIPKGDLLACLSDTSRRKVFAFLSKASADEAHPAHADAADFLAAWTAQVAPINVLSPDWTGPVGKMLAAGLVTQAEHDALIKP